MQCPLPKWFRHRFVSECKPMLVGINDAAQKAASLAIIEKHYRFACPFEAMSFDIPNIERNGEKIGSYRITVERTDI
jgi:hypothetical protein